MSFDADYANVPAEQREALRQFRAMYPENSVRVGSTDWTYITAGAGNDVILWLVGGLKMADAAYRSIPLLADRFRIIAPNYPALPTMNALADGLAAILDAEGVAKAAVLSGSFGGMLAQCFIHRHSDRVDKLILSTTTPPDKTQIERYQQILAMVRAAPEALVREQAVVQMFGIMQPPQHEAEFWQAYLKELFTKRLLKADIESTYQAIADFMQHDFTPDDLDEWAGQILILDSDNDSTFGASTQDSLTALYPAAQRHTFAGAGHSPGSTQRDLYFEKVRTFFKG